MWETLFAVGSSLLGGYLKGNSAKAAGKAEAAAAAEATALNKAIYQDQRNLAAPAYLTGGAAANKLAALYGIAPQNYSASLSAGMGAPRNPVTDANGDLLPYIRNGGRQNDVLFDGTQTPQPDGYPTLQTQDTSSTGDPLGEFMSSPYNKLATEMSDIDFGKIKNQLGAAGKSISGPGEARYAKTLAGNRYNAFGDYTNGLRSMAGMNQTASSQISGAASQYGANAGNSIMAAGQAKGNALAGAYKGYGDGIAGAIGAVTDYGKANWGWG